MLSGAAGSAKHLLPPNPPIQTHPKHPAERSVLHKSRTPSSSPSSLPSAAIYRHSGRSVGGCFRGGEEMKKTCKGGPKVERKTVEKNRRIHVKSFCFKLSSSIPKGIIPKHGDGKEGEEIVFSISDIKTTYKDAILPTKWKAFKTVIFREADDGLRDSDKIAAFDFDGCLVNTSLKRSGPDEWSLLYSSIPEKLQNLYSDDYKLVIFTNESNIERWKNKRQVAIDSKIGRIENLLKCVKVPMQVFIACGLGKGKDQPSDPFRKPNPGMWRILEKYFNSGIAIDMDRSFYVGDAAGRKNDHSDADAKFAEVVGLKFHLPEDFFGA